MIIYSDKFQEIYKQPEYANPFDDLVDFPLILDVELKRGRGEFMRPLIFFEALNQAVEYGAKGIRFGRGGDPLAHRNVIRFIRAIRREKLLVSLETRGRLLYLGIDTICNSGLNTFILYIKNISENSYRGKLRDLSVMKKRRKFGPFIKIVGYTHLDSKMVDNAQDEFKEACDSFELLEIRKAKKCPEVMRSLQVCWNGDVLLCPTDYIGLSKIGNIQETNLHKLWHSEKALSMRIPRPHLCDNCVLWRLEND